MVPEIKETQSQNRHWLINWGHWFTASNIILAILVSLFYFIDEPGADTLLSRAYFVFNIVGQMAFVTFVVYVLIIFPITLAFPRPSLIRGLASLVFTLYFLVLAIDIYSYNNLGYHIFTSDFGRIVGLLYDSYVSEPVVFIAYSIVITLFALGYQLTASNFLWHRLNTLQEMSIAKVFARIVISFFLLSHIIHIWADATLDLSITRQDNVLPLSYPTTAKRMLAKYGLLDDEAYLEKRNENFKVGKTANFPTSLPVCTVNQTRDTAILLTTSPLPVPLGANWQVQPKYARSTLGEQALKDIVFSVPKAYQRELVEQERKPSLFEVAQSSLLVSDTEISDETAALFDAVITIEEFDIQKYSNTKLLTFYLTNTPETVISSLNATLAQKGRLLFSTQLAKQTANSIIGSIGYSPLYIANAGNTWTTDTPIGHFDIVPTILTDCQAKTVISIGTNIQQKRDDDIVINKVETTLYVYQKDKVMTIDGKGDIKSFSTTFKVRLDERENISVLIDAMKTFNKYK